MLLIGTVAAVALYSISFAMSGNNFTILAQQDLETTKYRNMVIDLGDGVKTNAQLTYPAVGKGPFPGVLIISGSGGLDKNGTAGPKTTPEWQIAQHLSADRIVASIDTADFIGNWSTGPNSFAIDPPNVALVVDDDVEQRQDLAAIELYNPEYDSEANTLKYDIVAENGTSIGLPGEFGQSTLMIDDDGGQGPYQPGKKPSIPGGITGGQFQPP
jgi:hypothetical protein